MVFNKKINEILESHLVDNNVGLLNGNMGTAFYYLYYSRVYGSSIYYDKGLALIDEIINNINRNSSPTFCSGIAGVAWGLLHLLENNFIDIDTDELLNEVDPYLFDTMVKYMNEGNWDFLHGASGVCLYFIKRHKYKDMSEYLQFYLKQIDSLKEKSQNGSLKWESIISRKDDKLLKGYNICLSHGMSSLVVIFSKLHGLGIESDLVKELLSGSIKYILNQQLDINKTPFYFPLQSLESSANVSTTRLAWCYGDLGVAISLFCAGKATQNEALVSKAVEILLSSLKNKNPAMFGVQDAGICHGSSGIALIYKRMYHLTNLIEFNEAANYWYNETLKFATYKDCITGFKAWREEVYGGPKYESGLLDGTAGIGLSLLSSISDIPINWDECLLLY